MIISSLISLPVFLLCFFSAAYNLTIYASSQQGIVVGRFGRAQTIKFREILVLFSHIWPIIMMLGLLMSLGYNIS